MKVIIYTFEEGEKRQFAELSIKDGRVVCTEPRLLEEDQQYGIVNVVESKLTEKVFPKDGELFLRNLPYHYRNPYFFAELVED